MCQYFKPPPVTTMTRVWSNGTTNHHQEEALSSCSREVNETDFNLKLEGKPSQQNGQSSDKMNGNHGREECDNAEDGDHERRKKSFFGLFLRWQT